MPEMAPVFGGEHRDASAQSDDKLLMLGLLRQIRASAQAVDGALQAVESSLGSTDATQRWALLTEVAHESIDTIAADVAAGGAYLVQTEDLLGRAPELRDWLGDEVTTVQLSWAAGVRATDAIAQDLGGLPNAPDQSRVDDLLRLLRTARPLFSRVIISTATLTIPARLNQFLAQASVGRSLNFKSMFANELPGDAERAEVLREISEAPVAVNGIVDLASGSVVAVSPKQSRRRLSYLLEIGALIIGGLLAYLIVGGVKGYLVVDPIIPRAASPAAVASLSNLFVVLLTFSGGAAFHFVIDLLKAQQGTVGSPQWAALDDWLLWLHAREMKIISSIVGLWVVFGAVLIAYPGAAPDPLATFFAGYSFDSLLDVVIKRFDAFAGPQIKQVAEVIAGQASTNTGATS
jgi:hypothetical protein